MHQQPNLSEQDLLNDILNQEKQLMSSYSTYIQEASCPNLRKILTNQFNQISNDQYQIFDHMRQKGYYQTKDASDQEVQQAKQNYKTMQNEIW